MSTNFDETLTKAKTFRYLNKQRESIKKLLKETRFNRDELEKLLIVHLKISLKNNGLMKPETFQDFCYTVFGITGETNTEKLFSLFDSDFSYKVSPESFVRNLSAMLMGTLNEQINFVWKVYSVNDMITSQTIAAYVKKKLIKAKNDHGHKFMVQEFVGDVMELLDQDKDGIVSYDDFEKSVLANPLLLECLGPCLPEPRSAAAFLTTINGKLNPVCLLPPDLPHSK